jgi:hypothetical protein
MTRRNAVLMSISAVLVTMAASVAAASGSEPYRSPDSILAGSTESSQPASSGYQSPDSILAADAESSQPASSGYQSLDSILAGSTESSQPVSSGYRSPDSILAVAQPSAPPSAALVDSPEPSGFAWGDALIGALTGFGLALMVFALRHAATRHRPVFARSRA